MKREPLNRAEKWCLAAAIFFGAALAFAPLWWRTLDEIAVAPIPVVQLPTPNAYDDYLSAAAQLRFKDETNDAIVRWQSENRITALPISPAKDVVLDSRYSFPATTSPRRLLQREYSIAEKTWLVDQNDAAFQAVDRGLRRSCVQPSRDDVIVGTSSHLSQLRSLLRAMSLRQQLRAQRGDVAGALRLALDEMQVAVDLSQNASLASGLTAAGGESYATSALWKLRPQLNAAQSRYAIGRFQALAARRPGYAQVLTVEKQNVQRSLLKFFQFPDWRNRAFLSFGIGNSNWEGRALAMSLSLTSKQRVYDGYTKSLDDAIARAAQPYRNVEAPPPSSNFFSDLLTNTSLRLQQSFLRHEAQSALLQTALALQTFKFERGTFPQNLDALVPRYLKHVPRDPFASQQTLRYKLQPLKYVAAIRQIPTGRWIEARLTPIGPLPFAAPPFAAPPFAAPPRTQHAVQSQRKPARYKIPETRQRIEYSMWPYTLYSVGFDAADNNGKPLQSAGRSSDERTLYNFYDVQSTTGDIVAGLNTR